MNVSVFLVALTVATQAPLNEPAPVPGVNSPPAGIQPMPMEQAPMGPADSVPGTATINQGHSQGYTAGSYGPLTPGGGYPMSGSYPVEGADCDCQPEYAGCPCENGCPPWRARRRCRTCYRDNCPGCQDARHCLCFCPGRCILHSTCDMYLHYPYCPVNYGYYYFRPYNWTNVAKHQNIAASWGLDPANPYSRVMFDQLYSNRPRAEIATPPITPTIDRLPTVESLLEPSL